MHKIFNLILGSVWAFWVALTIPLMWLAYEFVIQRSGGGKLFYWSGVFSIWLILAALAVTPHIRLFRTAPWNRWLTVRRRHIGVAAFGYGILHTVYWMQQTTVQGILSSIFEMVTLVGWVALVIFLAMAVTSNDWSVRRMGTGWKTLQRWIYLAAPLALLHWFMAEGYRMKTVIIYGSILIVLMGYRLWLTVLKNTKM